MGSVARPTAAKAIAPAAQTGLRTTPGRVSMPEDCRGRPQVRFFAQRYLVEILVVRPEANGGCPSFRAPTSATASPGTRRGTPARPPGRAASRLSLIHI